MEISPEKKGRESEMDLENGKAESTGAVEVSVLPVCYKFFYSWMDLYLGVFHRTFPTH